jgi:hypothetical protein
VVFAPSICRQRLCTIRILPCPGSRFGGILPALAFVQFLDRDAVFFIQNPPALGTDLGQFVQRLISEILVFVVYFLEQQYVFVKRAIIQGLGFHTVCSAKIMPNPEKGVKSKRG